MRKSVLAFAVVAVFGFVVLACGGGDKKNACEKAGDVMKQGMDQHCSGKSDDCWFCDCYNRNLSMDVTVDGTEITYSCVQPDPTPAPACEGSVLDQANQCLDDKTACQNTAASTAQSACDSTLK